MNANQVTVFALRSVSILRVPIAASVARDFTWIQMEDPAQVNKNAK